MFDSISGTLVRKTEAYAVVDVGGVGFKLLTTQAGLNAPAGGKVCFYTYLHVREDVLDLYGFSTPEERSAFELLLSVSGVGPKAALSILSVLSFPELALAIVTNNPKAISKAGGVGPKLAQRIILDLKDKIQNKDLAPAAALPDVPAAAEDEALEALLVLGYRHDDALRALKNVPADASVEDKIKQALQNLQRF